MAIWSQFQLAHMKSPTRSQAETVGFTSIEYFRSFITTLQVLSLAHAAFRRQQRPNGTLTAPPFHSDLEPVPVGPHEEPYPI